MDRFGPDGGTERGGCGCDMGPRALASGQIESDDERMPYGNRLAVAVLSSPLHRLLSGSTAVLRYCGRKSGRIISTPVMYAEHDDTFVVYVGDHPTKKWWRNFASAAPAELLVRGRWVGVTGEAKVGPADNDIVEPLLATYGRRFPRAVRPLRRASDGTTSPEVVLVEFHGA
jgi:hypothetical protein